MREIQDTNDVDGEQALELEGTRRVERARIGASISDVEKHTRT